MFFRSALLISLFASTMLPAQDIHYLALGDSISFGLDIRKVPVPPATTPRPAPSDFVGYPEVLDSPTGIPAITNLVNLSCPGETSASFIDVSKPDNQCHFRDLSNPGFKAAFGVHSPYIIDKGGIFQGGIDGAQLTEALLRFDKDPAINLVTLNLGGNDLLLLQARCSAGPASPPDPACVLPQLPGVLAAYAQNLKSILQAIRGKYNDKLVLVTFYSPNYTNTPEGQLQMTAVSALNGMARLVALGFNVKIADGYTAFAAASRSKGGDPCAAGLLVRLSETTCDVHPSLIGQTLLAKTVMDVYNSGYYTSRNKNQQGNQQE
jgi:lysophospholipase L1-like esterase